jgi:hypothetical protein
VSAVRLLPLSLLAGLGAGIATVLVHQWWWGLALGAVVTALVAVVTPRGWGTRLPFALGDALAVGALSVPRPEGDYLVGADAAGYTVLGVTVLVLGFAIATLPRPGRVVAPSPDGHAPEPTPFAGRE